MLAHRVSPPVGGGAGAGDEVTGGGAPAGAGRPGAPVSPGGLISGLPARERAAAARARR